MKNNKIINAILIVFTIGLFFCIIILAYNSFNIKEPTNVIDIDNCSGKDCNKDNDNKKNNDSNNNINNNPSSGDTSGNSGSSSSNGNNSGGSNSNGTGTGNGNGSGTGNGSGSGSGSGSESSSDDSGESGESGGSGTTPTEEPAPNVEVSDNDTKWGNNTSLRIFDVDEIKPGDNGFYEFAINNVSDGNIAYSVDFVEENQYNVNLLYKLRMNNNYVAGDSDTWVTLNELDLKNKILDSKYMDSFYLEWKWVDSDHDTIAGKALNAKYKLSINVLSNETTEHDTSGSGSINPYTGDRITIYIEVLLGAIIGVLLIILLKRKKNENN
ncbi:MAG: hypothetical protein IKE73_04340 [Bacilli bacterium]|nr:hypothetical protein [Bacilli bacterium]